jgi:hypothetical protein
MDAEAFGRMDRGRTGKSAYATEILLNRFKHGDLSMTKPLPGARMRTFGGLKK